MAGGPTSPNSLDAELPAFIPLIRTDQNVSKRGRLITTSGGTNTAWLGQAQAKGQPGTDNPSAQPQASLSTLFCIP